MLPEYNNMDKFGFLQNITSNTVPLFISDILQHFVCLFVCFGREDIQTQLPKLCSCVPLEEDIYKEMLNYFFSRPRSILPDNCKSGHIKLSQFCLVYLKKTGNLKRLWNYSFIILIILLQLKIHIAGDIFISLM